MARRLMVAFLPLAMILTGFTPTWAAEKIKAPMVDLLPLLAPPPAQDSAQTKAELQELLDIQKTRTKEEEAYAQGDAKISVFRFSDIFGDKFTEVSLPLTAALFEKALKAGKEAVSPVKKFYSRPRPFVEDPDLHPCVDEDDKNTSYPSGHTTAGTLMAVLLANMVPEKKAELFKRGWDFGHNRMVAGVHYKSDVETGRIAGTLVAAGLLRDKSFMRDFEVAKRELRAALGY